MTLFGMEIGGNEIVFACRSDSEFEALCDEASREDGRFFEFDSYLMRDIWYGGAYCYTKNPTGGGFSVRFDGERFHWCHCNIPWYEDHGYRIVEVGNCVDVPVDLQFDLDFDTLFS